MARKSRPKPEPAAPALHHGGSYAAHRRAAYPPIVEFIDAFYHERRGNPAPMQAYLAAIDGVKATIRKPEQP